ncbi:hypothetical protein Q4574_13245 [Aliiglaciecola sp. 3_MG-2023]|uniref:DUF3592 domain-containing protein n=1 Tax=Aliiglaciecola sp. 3_MG-2023 TaxID=3062644 RepID=UPI0026E12AC8|nr:DUF3592 domain-containing protein [Aliiglaciecola sp. 3_MG-2023]MDO6694253.1 hypothetical protein [Aliiglaciecola sp. 3_MG-2023]
MNIIPLIGGIGFGSLGLFILFDYYRFNKGAIKVYGKILRYDEYESKNKDGRICTMYRPSFDFSANGKVYEVKSKTSFNSKIIPVGKRANVLYQQGDESNARLAKGNSYWLGILFIGLSIPAIYFGAQ